MRIPIERVKAVWKKAHSISEILKELRLNSVYEQLKELLQKVELVTGQSKSKYIVEEKVPSKDRIFSIFEDYTEFLNRG